MKRKISQTIVILLKAILRVVDVFTVKLLVKKAYKREVIITVKLGYKKTREKEAKEIIKRYLQ
ncbi:hypothetical protein NXX71_02865 [Bacteroides faecis]|nr:hypothetical protein [Bacteroides faecis]